MKSLTAWKNAGISLGVILALWQAVVWATGVPAFILPGPLRVAGALYDNAALIAEHAQTTLVEIVLGIVIGTALGGATALSFMLSRRVRRYVQPMMVISQALPVFALAPLLTLWLGYGIWSKIAMTTLIIYFPVTVAFHDGLRRTDPGFLDLAKTMGASPGMALRLIRIPAALPALGSGLKLASVYAPIGAVIGEWVGASQGLGYLMLLANGRAKTDLMFASVIVLACLALVLYFAVSALAARLTRWQPESDRA